jgi:molecular chaperone GrpE
MKKEKSPEKKKPSELETIKQELEKKTDFALRLQAEFANFKKRSEENQAKIYELASSDIFKKLINVFDDFDLALNNCSDLETFKKGIEMVYAKMNSTSEDIGLEKIKTVGEQFDPHKHEVLLTEASEKPEQSILEELQSGYKLKNMIIRTAKVKVATKMSINKK